MRYLLALFRLVFSLTFILSSILKLVDPVGTGLIVKEYLDFLHLGFLEPASIGLGIALSAVEFSIGISTLIGLRMKLFATLALAMVGGFTLLTLYLAIFNPISDCGCFGEAIHLSNKATFIKNVVLLILAFFIFLGRGRATRIAPPWLEWSLIAVFSLLALSVALDAYYNIPRIDFTAYNVGTDIVERNADNAPQYETTFVYEKDGVSKEFKLDEIPDESWTFVDSHTELLTGSTRMAQVDFELEQTEGRLLAVTIYDPAKLSEKQKDAIEIFRKKALLNGYDAVIYGPSEEYRIADRKSLMTLNRSNGGAVYIQDGVIIAKWANSHLPELDLSEVLAEDPDVLVLQSRIKEQLYVSILIAGILILLALVRYFCRILL